jgi:hypothetical protein
MIVIRKKFDTIQEKVIFGFFEVGGLWYQILVALIMILLELVKESTIAKSFGTSR